MTGGAGGDILATMIPRKTIVALAFLVAGTTAAEAHPPPFYWMDDLATDRRVGFEILGGPSDLVGDATVVGGSIFGHFSLTDSIALEARLPLAYSKFTIMGVEDDGVALGNLALGFQISNHAPHHVHERALYGLSLMAHLPTASNDGTSQTAATIASAYFIPDPGRYLVDTTTLRLRGDFRYEVESLFFQLEGALDFEIRDGAEDRTNVVLGTGLGFKLSPYFALLGELTTVSDILEDSGGENFIHTLDLGMRYHDPGVMFGFRVYVPLDERLRDANVLGIGADAAVRF